MEGLHAPKQSEGNERVGDWEVVEKFGAPKNLDHGSEDGVYFGKDFVLVCDGVTSHTPEKINGLTPGQFAIRAAFDAVKYLESDGVTSDQLVSLLTVAVQDATKKAIAEGKDIPEHPSFVFVAFFPKENKIVRVRDCSYLIDGVGNNPPLAADQLKRKVMGRLTRINENLEEHQRVTPEEIKEVGREVQWSHRNNPRSPKYRYGVIDGTDVPEEVIEYIDVPKGAHEVVLTSDGYPVHTLAMTLAETNKNLQADMQSHPTTENIKSMDDLTYVRLRRKA